MSRDWTIGFVDADHLPMRWLPRGCQHVFALCWVGETVEQEPCFLLVNPRLGRLEVGLLTTEQACDWWALAAAGGGLYSLPERTALLNWACPGLSCVAVIKRLLGVWWPLTFTPAQLRRQLERAGAQREG